MKQMKRNIVLEQIIRKALLENEGANITVETAVLNTQEDAEMDVFHNLVLEPSKIKDITYNNADGIAVMVSRAFGRGKDKEFNLSIEDLKKYAILKLDSLSAGLQAKTSTDYVWILDMQDTKLDKRDKPKEKRIFATYRFPAFYINKSLIGKSLTTTTAGYIQTIGRGAMLFDRAKIKDSEWKRSYSATDQPTKIGDATTIVKSNLEFGSNSGSVPQLFKYFFTKASAVIDNAASVKNSTKFGCELRAACEQFQTQEKLPVTGKWDDASIKRASELYAKQIPSLKPEEAPAPEYVFSDTTNLKERIATCKLETAAPASISTDLQYTDDQIIKATSTSAYSDITKYFQNYLVNVIKNKTNAAIQTALNGTGQYFTKVANDIDGYWGKNSKGLTTNYKKLTKLSPANGTVTSAFIKSLKDLNSQGATVKTESRILLNKIILEQVTFDLTVDTETTSTDINNDTKVIKKSTDTDKDKQPKDTDKDKDKQNKKTAYDTADQQSTVAKTQWNLISNAIKFMQGIGNLNYNNVTGYDVEDSIRVINKYVVDIPANMSQRAAYIDMIMRLLYGDLQSVAKKFPKQFNYFITRNKSSATSVDYLRNIRPHTLPYTGLTSLLWGNGRKLGLDEDEARGIRRSLSLIYSPKFVFLSGVTPKLKLRYNKKQVEDRILYAYDNKIWGDPDGKRINVPKAKSKAKPKK
jgi:hypothetical protein